MVLKTEPLKAKETVEARVVGRGEPVPTIKLTAEEPRSVDPLGNLGDEKKKTEMTACVVAAPTYVSRDLRASGIQTAFPTEPTTNPKLSGPNLLRQDPDPQQFPAPSARYVFSTSMPSFWKPFQKVNESIYELRQASIVAFQSQPQQLPAKLSMTVFNNTCFLGPNDIPILVYE
ncbi:hypothetical protein FHL15_005819 [Xylaria flabelliformis]|uniref:Uncharacterized protein n=1 Tax=Xylaria flabelliformis TaxID=2512241 RepID=A0A553HZ59_9PEZI|nr:hypothetical protein FHL15_005819 [Xylaria flabelliformis]